MRSRRTLVFIIVALCLILVPVIAEFLNVPGWDWSGSDYAIIAVLLVLLGTAIAAVTNSGYSGTRRAVAVGCVLLVLALYVHLAVGIVDTWPLAGS